MNGFLTRPGELALELLESGITAMKPFERIRNAVGDRMDITVDFHSLWQLLPAIRIAEALAPYDTCWHEDPIRMDSPWGL